MLKIFPWKPIQCYGLFGVQEVKLDDLIGSYLGNFILKIFLLKLNIIFHITKFLIK